MANKKTPQSIFPFENASIFDLKLSTRSTRVLQQHGIQTIHDLIVCLLSMEKIQNLGEQSRLEISAKLLVWMKDEKRRGPKQKETPIQSIKVDSILQLDDAISVQLPAQGNGLNTLDVIDIDMLGLSLRAENALKRRGVFNLAQLKNRITDLDNIYQIGLKTKDEIITKFNSWIQANSKEALQNKEIENFDESTNAFSSDENAASLKVFFSVLSDREVDAIMLLFGLQSGSTMTLQEVSDWLGVSVGRVNHLKKRAIGRLQNFLFKGNKIEFNEKAANCIVRRGGVLSELRLVEELNGLPVMCNFHSKGVLRLLRELDLRHQPVRLMYLEDLLGWTISTAPLNLIRGTAAEIPEVVTNSIGFINWKELYEDLLRIENLFSLNEELAFAITLCLQDAGILFQTDDGRWAIKGKKGIIRRNKLVDIIRKNGHPAHFRTITIMYNDQFLEETLNDQQIYTILVRFPETFVRVGRGTFGLAQWGLKDDGSIANLVRRIIAEKGEPMPYSEICDEVLKIWQVAEGSVYAAIFQDGRFSHTEDGKITLTDLGHTIEKVQKRSKIPRRERVLKAMSMFCSPVSTDIIAQEHNKLFPKSPLTETAVNAVFNTNPDLFFRFDSESFVLKEWGFRTRRVGKQVNNRKDLLIQTMKFLERPSHVLEILEKHNSLFPDRAISESHLRALLYEYKDTFIYCKKGVYELAPNK